MEQRMNEAMDQEEQMLKDLEMLDKQDIAIMGGTYIGELVKKIVDSSRHPVMAYNSIYQLGKIEGIRQERQRRRA